MNRAEAFATFSKKFVNESFRERFIHEATKKPERLAFRVCHDMGTVLPLRYKGITVEFEPETICLMLGRKMSFEEVSWSAAQRELAFGGVLVIAATGEKFCAMTEGSPKSELWGGDA